MENHFPLTPPTLKARVFRPIQKAWYLKFNEPTTQRALWLRFTVLNSGNGFKRVAETWAVYFQKGQNREMKKVAIKQTHEMDAFSTQENKIQIGQSELSSNSTRGIIESKGNRIEWNLTLIPPQLIQFNMIPQILSKAGLVKNSVTTYAENLLVNGTVKINGEILQWKEAPGMRGQMQGPKTGHSWVWAQCNSFVNEQGEPAPFIFEGLSIKLQLGPVVTPPLSSFFFNYKNQVYHFNTLRDLLRLKSKKRLNEWQFQADRGDLSFRGTVRAEHKDFAGLVFEDTNGSLLYCANSKLSDMKIHVYRKGKLETTFISEGTAAFEVVSRDKNPYVPLLL